MATTTNASLIEWIRGRMRERLLEVSDLSTRVRTTIAPLEKPPPSTAALTEHVTSLLDGGERGRVFFFGAASTHRLVALAEALGTTADNLRALAGAASRPCTLVLDPRLPAEVVQFLHEQEPVAAGAYRCLDVRNADAQWATPREALRDAARNVGRDAVVVSAQAADADYFRGADVASTTVVKAPRGWTLVSHPELVPLRPRPEPQLFDKAGAARRPFDEADLAAVDVVRARQGDVGALVQAVASALKRDEVITLSVRETLQWFGIDATIGSPDPYHLLSRGDREMTFVWQSGDTLFAIGPAAAAIRAHFAPYHDVREPAWASAVESAPREEYREHNPWSLVEDEEGPFLSGMRAALGAAYDAKRAAASLCPPLQSREQLVFARFRRDIDLAPVGRTAPETDAARTVLRDLASRPLMSDCAQLAFLLPAMAEADLVALAPGPMLDVRVCAHVGAGNLVELRLARFPDSARAVRVRKNMGQTPSSVFDGGDVVFVISRTECEALEGIPLVARRRRQAEAAREAAAADAERRRQEEEDDD